MDFATILAVAAAASPSGQAGPSGPVMLTDEAGNILTDPAGNEIAEG